MFYLLLIFACDENLVTFNVKWCGMPVYSPGMAR